MNPTLLPPRRLIFGNKTRHSRKTGKFLSLCIFRRGAAQRGVLLQVVSMLNWALSQSAIVGSLKSCPTLKGEVAVAGGALEEEDLPVVSFRPERGLGQVVRPFNVAKLFICACGSETGRTVH